MKWQSSLLTFSFAFGTFERWLQNFCFVGTDSKFQSLELGNGKISKSQYRSYLGPISTKIKGAFKVFQWSICKKDKQIKFALSLLGYHANISQDRPIQTIRWYGWFFPVRMTHQSASPYWRGRLSAVDLRAKSKLRPPMHHLTNI
jgi:hypothetical protein